LRLLLVAAVVAVVPVAPAAAQYHEPDPAASKAFADMVRAFRGYQNLRCTSTVTVAVHDGSAQGTAQPIEAELILGRVDNARRVVVRLRGFTCWIGDGSIAAVHESNPHAYYRASDGGAPYYALLSAFVDLPFPEFALAFGDEEPTDVVMQLHPKAPWLRPTGIDRQGGADAVDRRTILHLSSDHERAEIELDPMTQLPARMSVTISGGSLVPRGSTLQYKHEFEHELPVEPFDASMLVFEPGTRQRTDSIAALPRRAPATGADTGQPRHELVGAPAPPFAVPVLDGDLFDLAAQRGRIVVLDFWATWCGPCIAAMPHLHRIASDLKADGAPVDFYTVNTFERFDPAERTDRVRRFWNEREFTLPVLLDMDNAVARQYAVPAIPMTVIIGADGVVSAVHVGFRQDVLIADIAAARAALEPAVE